jgi:hypothetical protein
LMMFLILELVVSLLIIIAVIVYRGHCKLNSFTLLHARVGV